MQNKLQQDAVKYVKRNHRRRVWRKFVRAMACVVVFCTTYALILPAITMEKTQCGLAEHTHSAGCYEKLAAEPVVTLACTYESLGVHVHNADCYDSEHNLLCGMADFLVHQHDAGCRDANGELVCRLPEIQVHEHTEDCYQTVETETGHRHDDACYRLERGELTCELTETEGHTHDKTCFTQGELICRLPEQEAHIHGPGCSEQVLVCEDETESHTHTDVCWQTNSLCGLEETEGHTHASSCYESLLTCERGEEEPHTHTDDCYQQISVLICDLEEGTLETTESAEATAPVERELICEKRIVRLHSHDDTECYEIHLDENGNEQKRLICTDTVVLEHIHGESCYVTEQGAEETDALTCTVAEGHVHAEGCCDESGVLSCTIPENHIHGDMCYGTWQLICTEEEHTHDLTCMSDPEADVETEAVWQATFADISLTGEWDEDLLAIARSQLDYQESTRNYEVMEDGETIRGYTRYGEWYGSPYEDWDAMFVSFCLHYAGIPRDAIPYEANSPGWIEALQNPGCDLYRPAGEYTPEPGDLIFFDWEEDGVSDHVGIVEEMIPAAEDAPARVKTIEGDSGDRVAEQTYNLDDSVILGYGQLPEKPPVYVCGLREHTHDASCMDENEVRICGLEEHTHSEVCLVEPEYFCAEPNHVHTLSCQADLCELDGYDQAYVRRVIDLIDQMPSADEIESGLAGYADPESAEAEAWLTEIYQLVGDVYREYYFLGIRLQSYVVNAEKLLELENIWSAQPLIDAIQSAAPTVGAYTSTKDFVELNLYDYNSNINQW